MTGVLSWLLVALAWSAGILLAVILWRRLFAAPMPPIFDATLNTAFRRRHFSPEAEAERHGLAPGMRVLEIGPAGGYLKGAAHERSDPAGASSASTCSQPCSASCAAASVPRRRRSSAGTRSGSRSEPAASTSSSSWR